MENFIVSARKYRPATFDMVVGQESITNTLKSAIKNNHLAQSYLFCGPRGVGKTTCARIFAKTINCSNLKENGEACDKCESCISFNTLRSFNIHELDAASNNKVDDIRSLTDQVRIPPQVGKYSIYIIDEVHMLSPSAFNAFLKTLEEPPSHAIFILATTEKHKIIPTILSRCQIFDFKRIRIEEIVKRLLFVAGNENVSADEEALHVIAHKADGALRDALSIFDQIVSFSGKKIIYKDVIDNLNVLDYEYYFDSIDKALEGNVSEVLMIFNEILEKGFDGHNFVAGLNSHLRNLLVSKDEVTLRLLEATPSVKERYHKQAVKSPVDFLYKALETGSACDLAYKNSKNQRLHVELSLIKLCLITSEGEVEKKKTDTKHLKDEEQDFQTPQRSERISQSVEKQDSSVSHHQLIPHKPEPVKEKESKAFSIKNIISEDTEPYEKPTLSKETHSESNNDTIKSEFNDNSFSEAWSDFTEEVITDGPRVASMFKSIRPELQNEDTILLHLSNAAQKDMFVQNYKQKLINFLATKFRTQKIDIETVVDLSETNEILYSDEQKYNYLTAKYPVIKDMKKAFNLDIE
ncbi:MAG: DNA polymerase III subunit gamma/tau [Odoribacter sp.]|nr:DNA polymerase III subunit gamma/tau [Odoribacter sp.]